MISKQGDTLQGVSLTQGNIQVSTGVFKDATTFYCHTDGTVEFTFLDDAVVSFPFVVGDAFPFKAKSIEVTGGVFSIGWD